jgi:autotransporter passenger strand-loop-strand repeat protein
MSDFILISGETVSGLVVSAGTDLEIGSGGVAIDTMVKDGGVETVLAGGITTSTSIRAGGFELVSSGGTAIDTAVKDGGSLILHNAGIASGAVVSGGGTMIVSAGGVAIDTESAAAAVLFVTNLVSGGQTISGLSVTSGSPLDVASGGLAVSTSVISGGSETISSGGTASGTVVGSGATLEIQSGGSAAGTIVSSGGTFIVLSGGSATGTVISNGGLGSAKLVVNAGQMSSGLVANSVTSIFVTNGGVTSDTTVTSGGSEVVSAGGTEIGAVVGAGGFDFISGVSINEVVSGVAQIEGGVVNGLTITGQGSVSAENAPLDFSVLSNTTITGDGSLALAMGGEIAGTVVFGGQAALVIDNNVLPFATLSGFTPANTLDLEGVAYSAGGTTNFSDGSLVITEGGQNYVLQFAGNYATSAFTLASDQTGGTLLEVTTPPCFAAGTLIATPQGAISVERLAVGDIVLTEGGGVAPITWIGSRRIDCSRHPEPARIWPVRIRADAFAPARPTRDLFLSPDHAVLAEGVLIPVKHLLNGRTVAQVAADEVTYFHLELPRHAAILAEGLPVETYLDTGDRGAFTGAEGPRLLHPVFGSERGDIALAMDALGCAPFRVTGPEVEQVRAVLAERASAATEPGVRESRRRTPGDKRRKRRDS